MAERWAYVHPSMHDQPKLRDLSDGAWRLLAYLLTAEREHKTPGVILGRIGHHTDRLNRKAKWFRDCLAELVTAGVNIKHDLEAGLIWLPNSVAKYQPCSSASAAKGWSDEWWRVPACPLKEDLRAALREAVAPFEGQKINGKGTDGAVLPGPGDLFVDSPPPTPNSKSATRGIPKSSPEATPPSSGATPPSQNASPEVTPATTPGMAQVSGIRVQSSESQISHSARVEPRTPPPDLGDRRKAARRRIWLAYVARFNALHAELKSELPEMADRLKNLGEESISAYLVDCGAAIEAGEKTLMHVLAVAEDEARRSASLTWFGEGMWTAAAIENRKARKVGGDAKPASNTNRAIGSAPPRQDHPDSDRLKDFGDA